MRVWFAQVHTVPRTASGIQITDCAQPLTLVLTPTRSPRALLFIFLPFLLGIFCCGPPAFSLKHCCRTVRKKQIANKKVTTYIKYILPQLCTYVPTDTDTDNHGHHKKKTLKSAISWTVEVQH